MRVGIPKERRETEQRCAASPETVKRIRALGAEVVVERGAGTVGHRLGLVPLAVPLHGEQSLSPGGQQVLSPRSEGGREDSLSIRDEAVGEVRGGLRGHGPREIVGTKGRLQRSSAVRAKMRVVSVIW